MSDWLGSANFSGSEATRASRSSFGYAKPITVPSREKDSQTMRPIRNFTLPCTNASLLRGSALANPRTSSIVTMAGAVRLAQELGQVGLRQAGNLGLLGLAQLRGARILADDQPSRLAGHRVRDLRTAHLQGGLRLLARVALERPRDHVRVAAERPFDRLLLLLGLEAKTKVAELLHECAVGGVLEPLGDRLGTVGPNALDLLDVVHRGVEQTVDVAEVPRQVSCGDPADVRDVEPEEDLREGPLLRLLDRRKRSLGRDLAEAAELEQLVLVEPIEVGLRAE